VTADRGVPIQQRDTQRELGQAQRVIVAGPLGGLHRLLAGAHRGVIGSKHSIGYFHTVGPGEDKGEGCRGYLSGPSLWKTSWLATAVARCQKTDPTFPRVTAHDLRHTAASLAISAGANPKVVQRMLGHASAAMTLDVYADLFDSDLDSVAENVSKMWPRQVNSR